LILGKDIKLRALNNNDKEKILAHISECKDCRKHYDDMNSLKSRLSPFSNDEEIPNSNLSTMVMESIRNNHQHKFNFFTRINTRKNIVIACVIILLFIKVY